ncbi:MAG: succinate dehydrogenase, cytochrome b556 subunit [Hyphomicrobiaceae bacterium]|nr:succinate dehydrogenase, cytochrome b556 subunit [Hyphomicrobiaceae bacterium]
MAEVRHTIERPLSPHLGIYRPLINMVMSIVHRITGVANYVGALLIAAWLVAVAMGPDAYATANAVFGHPLGKLVLVGYSWSVIHHMLGGIRHLIWDTGRGLEIGAVNALCWTTILGSLALTVALWLAGIAARGGL